ncbi:F12K21.25 [Salix koriyanagi]|uniref:F12K21.25 n=1 Tax=Salix koriyanagi TaxID=2511006 RepID=A0A9Q0VZN4_9ROSI|nr:F12K21.25 [Salix koriyanagi]
MINLSKLLNFSDSSWNATRDPCSWKGVTCSSGNSSVTSLFLSKLGLSNSNFLPDVCKIETLQSLDLSNNRLSLIPDDFVNESLDLSFNSLSGNVSQQLDGLLALKILNLSFNKFSGPLPVNLGKSLLLEKLQLSMNQFQGAIPQDIANCQNLNLLDLSGNVLDGSIPARIGNLTKLKFLVLSSNNLIGDIPANISNIPTLFRFAANQNQFDGRIPSGITRYLSLLDLSYNQLRGPIPADILSQSNLKLVDLSYNQLDGSIPSSISASLLRLRLGRNNFNGSIPSSFGKLEKLTYLELDENSLTGVIPPELGSCHSLALLNLAQNDLTGSVPTVLGNLNALQVLKLQHNRLDGEIPSEITRLQKLLTLNISWNSLTGSIPSSISNLQSLTHLNLQCNNLQGPIPVTVNSMNSLLELQLGQNKLNGTIPLMPLSGVIPGFRPYVSLSAGGNAGLINSSATKIPQEPPKKGKSVAVTVVLAVVAAVLSAGVVSIIVVSLFRRFLKVNNQQSQSGEELPPPQVIEGNLLTTNGIHRSNIDFTKAMEIAANPLNIELKTRFSTYYKATMPSGASYFVKKLNWSDKIFQLGSHHKFGQELEVLGKLSNTNVMTPLAYVLSTDSAYLFYEYAEKGTLFDVLHGKLGDALDWASRYSIAVGVAQGLTFLHGCTSGPILLLDLSSQNILLKSLKEPVVGDIELHKVIDPTKSTSSLSTIAGSVGYIPPGKQPFTLNVQQVSDFNLYEVVVTKIHEFFPMNIALLNDLLTSPAVRGQMLAVLKIALSCVSVSTEARPKMKNVLRMILTA